MNRFKRRSYSPSRSGLPLVGLFLLLIWVLGLATLGTMTFWGVKSYPADRLVPVESRLFAEV